VAGPLLAVLLLWVLPEQYVGPEGSPVAFGAAGRATAAVTAWMAVWWLTEAVEIYATALLPLALFPLSGASSMREAAAPYAHPLIFLFLGGFLLALTMQRWGLHRRLALAVLRRVGDEPAAMIGGFMAVTALFSMWVSNTATAIMMLPVATSVIALVVAPENAGPDTDADERRGQGFAVALMLGIAYAASIGGVATPIGTPPNLFLLSYLKEQQGLDIGFVRWMGVGVPFVVVFLPVTWWLLTRVLYPLRVERVAGGRELLERAHAGLGPVTRPERIVGAVFGATCLLWITRPWVVAIPIGGTKPFAGLGDTAIAMSAALLLFVLPSGRVDPDGRAQRMLDWETATGVPWGILLLFGGGLSLAAAIGANGVDDFLGAQVRALGDVPTLWVVLGVVTGIVFLTELTSNTATTATFVPLLAALAPGFGLDPLMLAVPAALAASCAFMLPVATPPNAIVFGSGWVTMRDMRRAGLWLNVVGIVWITTLAYTLVLAVLRAT